MRTILRCSLLAGLLVLALAACGGGEDPAVAFCAALDDLQESAPVIATLGDAADPAQIVQLGAALDNAWQDLAHAAKGLDEATQTAFTPYDEQYTAIPAITQETALGTARASLDAKNAIAGQVYGQFYAGQCQ